jgi:hypothetical protein
MQMEQTAGKESEQQHESSVEDERTLLFHAITSQLPGLLPARLWRTMTALHFQTARCCSKAQPRRWDHFSGHGEW